MRVLLDQGVPHRVERGRLAVAGLVTRRYPLAEINRAYEDIETDAMGRGVLVFPLASTYRPPPSTLGAWYHYG